MTEKVKQLFKKMSLTDIQPKIRSELIIILEKSYIYEDGFKLQDVFEQVLGTFYKLYPNTGIKYAYTDNIELMFKKTYENVSREFVRKDNIEMFSKLCANNIYILKYALGADIKTYDDNNNFFFGVGVGCVYDKENG